MTFASPADNQRMYSLDVLRGVAALVVVLWHWQHFFFAETYAPQNFDSSEQPLFSIFSVFYTHGSLAVELFFCISGFIFFSLYSKSVLQKKTTALHFFVRRFSRLYPLHIATFLITAILQVAYLRLNDHYFVYPFNDWYHALLNVFFVSAWGFETGWSFNAPVWSVSVEVLLYLLFFIVCLTRASLYLLPPCLLGVGILIYPENFKVASGLMGFFSAGIFYLINRQIVKKLGWLAATMLNVAIITFVVVATSELEELHTVMVTTLLFPAVVSLMALGSLRSRKFSAKRLRGLGDISFSLYLIHFPLQIIFVLVAETLSIERTIFYSPWTLLGFSVVLLAISTLSYYRFERPLQHWIRKKLPESSRTNRDLPSPELSMTTER